MKRFIKATLLAGALAATAPAIHASDHFAWGADIGTGIDVSGHDMSTFNLDAFFGYKNKVIDIVGVGAGIDMMVSNSCRTYPIYAIFRSSFRPKPSIVFMDLRCGMAHNQMSDATNQNVFYIAPAVGFNLAVSSKFKSYISVGYTFNNMHSYATEHGEYAIPHGIHLITARFGVTF